MGPRIVLAVVLAVTTTSVATAQAPITLTLVEAMARARSQHPSARAAAAAEREAEQKVSEARAGYYPRVDFSQTWQRGNQPVFVFSSLLAQRRFAAPDFAIDALNHPDPVTNHRSAFTMEQPLFDGALTRLAVQGARLGQQVAQAGHARVEQELALAAAQAYVRAVQLEAAEAAARGAVEAAESDLASARERRDAGVVTEADVLAVNVHLARMRQEHVEATGELRVARAQLNDAIGASLDERFTLALPEPPAEPAPIAALEREALERRPEVREAALAMALATNGRRTAQAAYLPQIGLQAGYEMNGANPGSEVSSWAVGVQVRVNLFRGLADRARVAAAREEEARLAAERERAQRRIRLEVRSALARLDAARARADVGSAALAQARESQRILRDRYESGMVTITDILRAAQAVLQAESQAIGARVDVTLFTIALDRAVGRI
jgi:outer membrane protein